MTQPVPESGSLAEVPLPRIFLDLYAARFTGRLGIVRGRTEKSFALQDGALIGSESPLPGETLVAVLEATGVIDREARARVEAKVRSGGGAEAAALLSLEILGPKQVFDGMREQIRRRAIDCFGWADARFELAKSEARNADAKAFRTDPFRLVQDGLRTHWPLDRMLEGLAPHLDRYASAGSGLGKVVRRLALDATVERMIAGLSGVQTLGTIIGSAAGSPAALAAFWVLDAAGALDYSDTPRASRQDDGAPEIEIEITQAGASAAAAAPARAAAAGRDGPAQVNPQAEKMRAEVLERLEQLDELDYYELLGVDPKADRGAIRRAYLVAAKRYHPDAIARLGLQDIRREAGEVFGRIAEANETLADPKRREAYDNKLAGGLPDVDVQVLAQAETFYRKGEILINMGDFRGALGYLKNAVELYPHECVYQSDLAWAYYKKSPPELESALAHIRKAIELDPSNQEAQFRQGVIERAQG